jgi:hypothetical protein
MPGSACFPPRGAVVASWRIPAAPGIEEDGEMNCHVHDLQRAAGVR